MREIIFKNLTSEDLKKKDIFVREVCEENGVVTRTERRYFYFIKDISKIKEGEDANNWAMGENRSQEAKTRHFHILKEHNDELGEERLICKVAGTFYAVIGREVYTIAFLHSFKVALMKTTLLN